MAKKKQGDGSVFQRKDGRWEGRIVVGYKENGYATPEELFEAQLDRIYAAWPRRRVLKLRSTMIFTILKIIATCYCNLGLFIILVCL